MRRQPLSERWAQRVAAAVYQLRDGVDLEPYALSPEERLVADRLREPRSLLELCRTASIDPEAVRRLLRKLRAGGALMHLDVKGRAVSGTVEVRRTDPPPSGAPRPGPGGAGTYHVTNPAHARDEARAALRREVLGRDPARARRGRHEQESGLVRRFLDSVRFKR